MAGCLWRVRPVTMTAMMSLLGPLPLGLTQGPGGELQRPLATVVIGGLVTSTLSTLIPLPMLYRRLENWRSMRRWPRKNEEPVSGELPRPIPEGGDTMRIARVEILRIFLVLMAGILRNTTAARRHRKRGEHGHGPILAAREPGGRHWRRRRSLKSLRRKSHAWITVRDYLRISRHPCW